MFYFIYFETPWTKHHDLDIQLGVAGNSDSIFMLTAVGDYNDLSGCRMLNILLSTSLFLHKKLWKTVQSEFMTVLLLQSALVMTSSMTSSIMSLTRWRRKTSSTTNLKMGLKTGKRGMQFCQTPDLGLGLGVDFTFPNNNNNNNKNPHLNFLRRDGTRSLKFVPKNIRPKTFWSKKK